MQVSVGHTLLAPISEARSGGGGLGPAGVKEARHNSLRNPRPLPPQPEQPRRHTLHPSAAATAAAATAAASDHQRPAWRRASSIRSSERGRQQQAGAAAQVRLENTYRMVPTKPFQLEEAEALLAESLNGAMRKYRYNAQSAPITARTLAQEIKNKVKQLVAMGRYKVIVLVTVTEPEAPAGQATARAVWSAETGDACATAEFRNSRVAASVAAFAFYCE